MEELRLFWLHVKCMIRKEFLATLKDRRMQIMLLAPALVQGFLFGYVANYNLDEVPYALVDLSHSPSSQQLLAHIDGSSAFLRAATLQNTTEIAEQVDAGDVILAIVIPEDFEQQLARGGSAPIEVIADGRNTSIASMASGYVSQVVARWNAERGSALVTVESRTWYNPNQTTRWTFLPSLIAMISFVQVIMLSGLSIAREREQGTFDQLLVTPLSPLAILVGKAVPPVCIGFLQSCAIFSISRFWFEVPFAGSFATLALALFIFMVSSTGIGLSISSVADNMQQVLVYVFVTVMPLVLLSGIATPVRNMPEALQLLTYLDPMRFAVTAVRRIYLEGAGFWDVAPNFAPMLLIAAVTLPLAGWLFRNKTT